MGELRGPSSVFGKPLEGTEASDRFSADDVNRARAILEVAEGADDVRRDLVLSVGLCLIRMTKRTTNDLWTLLRRHVRPTSKS